MDVKALFPLIDIDFAMKIWLEMRAKKKSTNLRNCVNWSMDVNKLYPSIDIYFVMKKCVEMIVNNISTLGTV